MYLKSKYMDFNKLNNKEFLQDTVQNEEHLLSLIEETQGFIFFFLEKYNIFPPLSILMKKLTTGGLNFILKNYALTQAQSIELAEHFSNKTEIVEQKKSEHISLEDTIKNKAPVFKNTILDYETIHKTQDAIVQIIKKDEDYDFQRIYKNSIIQLTKEQVLSLHTLIIELPFETMPKKFLSDSEYNRVYLKNLEKQISHYERMGSDLLKGVSLTKEHLGLVKKHLRLEHKPKYSNYKEIIGFTDLMTPMNFFRNYNLENLTALSIEDIRENLKEVSELFFQKDILRNVDYYDEIEKNLEKLGELIHDDLLKRFFGRNYVYNIFSEPKKASIVILDKIADYFIKNTEEIGPEKIQDFLYNLRYIETNKQHKLFLAYYESCAKNNLLDKVKYSSDVKYVSFLTSQEWSQSADINKLYITLILGRKEYYSTEFQKVLEKMVAQVDYEEGAILLKSFNLEEYIKFLNSSNKIKNSFFTYDAIPSDILDYLAQDPQYLDKVIENKKEMQKSFIISAIEGSQINFLKNYNDLYPLDIAAHGISQILDKPWCKAVLGDNTQRENQLLKDFMECRGDKEAPTVSAPIIANKVQELFSQRNFASLNKLYEHYSSNAQFKICFASLNKKEVENLVEDNNFLKIISRPLNFYRKYGQETEFEIDFTVKSLKKFIAKNNKKDNLRTIFSFVKDPAVLKNYLVKYEPVEFYYNHYIYHRPDFNYDHGSLIKAFINAHKNRKFFSYFDANTSFNEVIRNMSLEEMLLFEKEARQYPILYLSLSMHHIKNREWFEDNDKGLDENWHDFVATQMDLDIILQGIQEVLEYINKGSNEGVNKKFAATVISNFLCNTYYDRREDNDYKTVSHFTQEQTDKIVKFFLKEAPNFLINSYRICNITPPDDLIRYLSNQDYDLHKLMTSPIYAYNLNKERIQQFVQAIIDQKIKEKDILSLCYINYMLEQEKFDKNIKYETGVVKPIANLLDSYTEDEFTKEKLSVFENKFFLTTTLLDGKINNIKKVNKL